MSEIINVISEEEVINVIEKNDILTFSGDINYTIEDVSEVIEITLIDESTSFTVEVISETIDATIVEETIDAEITEEVLDFTSSEPTIIVNADLSGLQDQVTSNDNDITQLQSDVNEIIQDIEVVYDREIDELPDGNIIKGYALAGTTSSTAGWRIQKITFTGNDVSYKFANGNANFVNVWDDRLGYTY